MWGGQTVYSSEDALALNTAFYYFNINHPEDPYGAVILAYIYIPAYGYSVFSVDLSTATPSPTAHPRKLHQHPQP